MLLWVFLRQHVYCPTDVYLVAGDEVVVTKAGKHTHNRVAHGMTGANTRCMVRYLPPVPAYRDRPNIVTRPVMTTSVTMIQCIRRTVVAVTYGRAHGNSATISTRGVLR